MHDSTLLRTLVCVVLGLLLRFSSSFFSGHVRLVVWVEDDPNVESWVTSPWGLHGPTISRILASAAELLQLGEEKRVRSR